MANPWGLPVPAGRCRGRQLRQESNASEASSGLQLLGYDDDDDDLNLLFGGGLSSALEIDDPPPSPSPRAQLRGAQGEAEAEAEPGAEARDSTNATDGTLDQDSFSGHLLYCKVPVLLLLRRLPCLLILAICRGGWLALVRTDARAGCKLACPARQLPLLLE